MHIEIVKDYYGKVLKGSSDLKTMACCTPDSMPQAIKALLGNIHEEVLAKYYGCGLVVPDLLAVTFTHSRSWSVLTATWWAST